MLCLQASGELHVELTYRRFEDDDADSGYREAEAYALALQQHAITDFKVCVQAVSTSAQLLVTANLWSIPVYSDC